MTKTIQILSNVDVPTLSSILRVTIQMIKSYNINLLCDERCEFFRDKHNLKSMERHVDHSNSFRTMISSCIEEEEEEEEYLEDEYINIPAWFY